jgi:hypothetical protein
MRTYMVRRTAATLGHPPAPWRSGYAAACKAVYTGSIPVGASLPALHVGRLLRIDPDEFRHYLARERAAA